MPESQHALELLRRALAANVAGDVQGATSLGVTGTVNIIGAGSGGTSQIDNSSFVPGSGSITPIGGYFGGRQVSSGRTAAPAIDGSGVLQVNVVAGGAGGGIANLSIRGSANNDLHVGFASGAAGGDGNWAIPVVYASGLYPTVNVGAGTVTANISNIPTVNLGQGVVGSVVVSGSLGFGGLGGSLGVTQITSPWVVVGSVNVTPVASATVNLGTPLTVAGTANTPVHVGFASGVAGNDGNYAIPVIFASGFYPTVNSSGGGGGGFATVGVYGSVSIGGSAGFVGLGGSVGVTQITSPWVVTGSVNANFAVTPTVWIGGIGADTVNSALRVNVVAGGAGGGVANVEVQGTANTAIHVGFASGAAGPYADGGAALPVIYASGFYPTVWIGGIGTDTTNSALRVNVVAGGAGGGVANLTVRGSANTDLHVGYASGAGFNQDGGAYMPILGTINMATTLDKANDSITVYQGNAASLNVTAVGSVNTTALGGSLGVTQITNPWVITGSVNITGSINPVALASVGVYGSLTVVGSVNVTAVNTQTVWLTNVAPIDTSASIVPTGWPINIAASGYNTMIAGPSGAAGPKIMLYDFTLVTDATVGVNIQSPSGTYLTGSQIQLLPGAGWAKTGHIHNPILIGGSGNAATMFMYLTATAHVVGWAQGYTGTGN